MLKALWFLIRVAALAGAVAWFMRHPGTVAIGWQGYTVDTSVGFVAGVLAVFLFVYTHAHSLWRGFIGAPVLWRRYRRTVRRERGYRDVTAGLVAVAAGDARAALKYAGRTAALIPDAPLAKLLTAQAHLLNGDASRARVAFATLLDDAAGAFFGVKALLQETLRTGDHRAALDHIRAADTMQPGRAWIAKTLFDLETRNREWARAARALKSGVRSGVFSPAQARAHGQALLLAEADDAFRRGDPVRAHRKAAEAFALDQGFTPAALRLLKFYGHVGKNKAALGVIEKAWARAPHPALAAAWMAALPRPRKTQSAHDEGQQVHDWAARLARLNPGHHAAQRLMGAAAMTARRWPEARDLLTRACDYRGLAKLEKAETGNEAKTRAWLEQAADAPPDPTWVCAVCGHADDDWTPLCPHCGVFNAATWSVPAGVTRESHAQIAGDVLTAAV